MNRINKNLANFLAGHGSLRQALQNGELRLYSGPQPATADSAPTGTLLAVITAEGLARTAEVAAATSFTFATGTTSVSSITVGGKNILSGAVDVSGMSSAESAVAVADAINDAVTEVDGEYLASVSGSAVLLQGLPGSGAGHNGKVVAAVTVGGVAPSISNLSGGVDAVNGLKFTRALDGSISRLAAQVWQGLGLVTGTLGWYRLTGAALDDDSANPANLLVFRKDGSAGVSNADMLTGSATVVASAPQVLGSAQFYVAQSE